MRRCARRLSLKTIVQTRGAVGILQKKEAGWCPADFFGPAAVRAKEKAS
jgi:hypothetical protein